MKKKYYFVILFLILAILFIINASSVNAKIYKILDSEGNVIRLTNIPVLSIQEKEVGYTISPPPEGIIVITGQENKQEISSGSEKYDFRKIKWGMNKEEVKAAEKGTIVFENEYEIDFMVPDFDSYFKCGYNFLKDKVYRSTYFFIGEFTNKNDYIYEYQKWKEVLIKKYGQPISDKWEWKDNLLKNDEQEWGTAVYVGHLEFSAQWETPTTKILIMLAGINYEIYLSIFYASRELYEWANRILKESEK
jgi:hypothetical protein